MSCLLSVSKPCPRIVDSNSSQPFLHFHRSDSQNSFGYLRIMTVPTSLTSQRPNPELKVNLYTMVNHLVNNSLKTLTDLSSRGIIIVLGARRRKEVNLGKVK